MPMPLCQTTGRRKQAVARVRLRPGNGKIVINGRSLEEYFPNKLHQQVVNEPFVTTDLVGRFDVIARIHGGGITGQAGALRLGVARCLNFIDEEANRPALIDFVVTPEAVSSDGKTGLAWVPDLQALAAWDEAERKWRAGGV